MEQGVLHAVSTELGLGIEHILTQTQILHARLVVAIMAHPTSDPSTTKMENALAHILAAARLSHPNNSANG